MKTARIKIAAQYVGGALIAVFFVSLLSFIFSFLGTLFCAALAGMMLGAVRFPAWKTAPISLFFPLVIFVLLKVVKTELETRQVLQVALACLGIFWLAYGVAALLFLLESKAPAPADSTTPRQEKELATAPAVETTKTNGSLNIELLQGEWSGKSDRHPEYGVLRMRIRKAGLTLEALDPSGHVRALGSARLILRTAESPPALELTASSEAESETSAVAPQPEATERLPSTPPSTG